MQLTIPAISIVAATFLATFAFAPAIAGVAQQFAREQSETLKIDLSAKAELKCSPVAKISAALRGKECV